MAIELIYTHKFLGTDKRKRRIMDESSVVLPYPNMVTDFLKLCQLGNLKNLKNIVYPVEPLGDEEDEEEEEVLDAEKEPAIDVNMLDEKQMPGICLAARSGHAKVVDFLIEAHCDIEMAAPGGLRAIHHSCNSIQEACLRSLVNAGAEVNSKDDNGNTPLFWAASRGVLANAQILLQANGDKTAVNNNGDTLLHRSAANGHVMMCKFWVNKCELDVNAQNSIGDTPLHLAVKAGLVQIVNILLENNADKSIKNKEGMIAAEYGSMHANIMKALA